MKKIILFLMCLVSASSFAAAENVMCSRSVPTTDSNFCPSFAEATRCYCASHLPSSMCKDVNAIYKRMIAVYGSLEHACAAHERQAPKQDCIDAWNCYRNGGRDSHGGLCSATGKSCQ